MARISSPMQTPTSSIFGGRVFSSSCEIFPSHVEHLLHDGLADAAGMQHAMDKALSGVAPLSYSLVDGRYPTYTVFGSQRLLRSDIPLTQAAVRGMLFEVIAAGSRDPILLAYTPFAMMSVAVGRVDREVEKLLGEIARAVGLEKNHQSMKLPWFCYSVPQSGDFLQTFGIVHPAYEFWGFVEYPCSCERLADVMVQTKGFVLSRMTTDVLGSAGGHSTIDSWAQVFEKMVGVSIGDRLCAADIAAVTHDAASSPPDVRLRAKKMAMAGDYLLKSLACMDAVSVGDVSPENLSSILTTLQSNTAMTAKFSQTAFAGVVVCAGNISLSQGKVGANFLEATAYAAFKVGGFSALQKFVVGTKLFHVRDSEMAWLRGVEAVGFDPVSTVSSVESSSYEDDFAGLNIS